MNKNDIEATKTNGQAQAYRQTLDQPLIDSIRPQSIATFELLPPRVDVRLDYENLHISMKELEWRPNAKALVRTVKKIVQDLGIVVRIVAYADWYRLSIGDRNIYQRWGQRDWQRVLATMRVETRYLVNGNGKNMADMKMANDIRDLLERDAGARDTAEIIVLGTNDGDFRPLLETARQRRRRVVLLGVRKKLSKYLLDVVDANDIYYIDKDLQLDNQISHPGQEKNSKSPSARSITNGTNSSH